jgi:hypothetical protein
MHGKLRILNVGEGDLTIKFDNTNQIEKDRAAKIIGDLLKQGYAIMVQIGSDEKGPLYRRVQSFDASTSEYVVFGDVNPTPLPAHEEAPQQPQKKRGRPPTQRVSVSTPSVAVARTAGGYDPNVYSEIRRGTRPDARLIG